MGKNVVPIILIVLAIGVYFTYTKGKLDEARAVQATNQSYDAAITNADKLIKLRDQVLKDRSKISADDIAKLDKMIPDNVDNVRLIIDVNSIAHMHGLTLRGVHTSSVSDDANNSTPATSQSTTSKLSPVSISFSVSTTYQNFIAFMQDIERSLRILDISSVSLNSNDGGIYDYNVVVNTYWLKK
jgi:Tfp pilus assembly protein PilO